jgi:hypothetical protein
MRVTTFTNCELIFSSREVHGTFPILTVVVTFPILTVVVTFPILTVVVGSNLP